MQSEVVKSRSSILPAPTTDLGRRGRRHEAGCLLRDLFGRLLLQLGEPPFRCLLGAATSTVPAPASPAVSMARVRLCRVHHTREFAGGGGGGLLFQLGETALLGPGFGPGITNSVAALSSLTLALALATVILP